MHVPCYKSTREEPFGEAATENDVRELSGQ